MNRRLSHALLSVVGVVLAVLSARSAGAQVTYAVVGDLSSIGGEQPMGGVIRGGDGALYGTTYAGGSHDAGGPPEGCGIVYRLAPDNTLAVLHDFALAEGCSPVGELALGQDGALYGATYSGGDSGLGTVFKFSPTGTFTRLHSFTGLPGGSQPYSGLALGPDGLFYGVTQSGSTAGGGIIFRVSAQGDFTIVGNGTSMQAAFIAGSDGLLYGTNRTGNDSGGSVFRLTTAGQLSILHSFPVSQRFPLPTILPEGGAPLGELVEGPDGNFYGTTSSYGPDATDAGTIFRITTGGAVTVLHVFQRVGPGPYLAGIFPWAGLTLGSDGHLYGITFAGGEFTGGVVYRLNLATGDFSVLRSLDAGSAEARLFEASPGVFYGTNTAGFIFRIATVDNRAPVAQGGALTTTEDQAANGNLSATDADADPVTFSIVSNGTLGIATLTNAATGAFSYTPNPDVSGSDALTFRATDGTYNSNIATVTVTISPVNDAPVALDSQIPALEDTVRTATLQATDVDGPALTYSIVANGTRGSATITNSATGAFTYTPNPNANGQDTIRFQATDGTLVSNVGTFTLQIAPINDGPAATTGVVTTSENAPVNNTLQATDVDTDALLFSIVTQPAQGSVGITDPVTGAFIYTPGATAIGYDSFTFEVTDGTTAVQSTEMVFIVANSPRWPGQTVRVNVSDAGTQGNASTASSDGGSLSADGRYLAFSSRASNLIAGDTNGVSDVLVRDRRDGITTRVSVATNGAQATVSSSEPAISADGRSVAFRLNAAGFGSSGGGGQIFIHDRATAETTLISQTGTGAAGNDASASPAVSASGRYVAFESSASNLTPGDTNGLIDVFVRDRLISQTVRVSVSTSGAQSNGSSRATALSQNGRFVVFISGASNLVADDTNGTSDVFLHDLLAHTTERISVGTSGQQGIVDVYGRVLGISADGRFVAFTSSDPNLVPGGSSVGNKVFVRDRQSGTTHRISDSTAGGYDAAVSADGRYITYWNYANPAFTPRVFIHDRLALQTAAVSTAPDGAPAGDYSAYPAISADGRFVSFESAASNLVPGDTNAVEDIFAVGGVLVSPTSDSLSGSGGSRTVNVSFTYPGTSWSATSNASWITVTNQSSASADGVVTYLVSPNTTPTLRTGTLTVALQTVTVDQAAATLPVAQDGVIATNEDTPTTGTLSATDPNSDPLTYSIVTNGVQGVATIINPATGAFAYTPALNVYGNDAFTFKANDGTANSNVATVSVTIAPVNDAPVAINGSLTTNEDVPAAGTLSASDVDSPAVTFSIVANATKGTVAITNPATGAYTYTPHVNANGSDSFTFKANDGSFDSNVASVTVTIAVVNDGPVAQTRVVTTSEGTPVSGMLAASDPDGGAMTFSMTVPPTQGVVTITDATSGAFTYTPNPGASGYDPFTFQVSDESSSTTATEMLFVVASSPQWPGQIVRVDSTSGSVPSSNFAVSADGRFVAFDTFSPAIVAGDTNAASDVFVFDRLLAQFTRVSVESGGGQANGHSVRPALSADGRFVVFSSDATNLVSGDTNGHQDVFLHDRSSGVTSRVNTSTEGTQTDAPTYYQQISADGRFVVFATAASTLVSGDTNGVDDVFVRDRQSAQTTRVSVGINGSQGNFESYLPTVSADGRYVSFSSRSPFVAGDTNASADVFVHDQRLHVTSRVSVADTGTQGNSNSEGFGISGDGRFVVFQSAASNLVAGDTNNSWDIFVRDRDTGQTVRASLSSNGAQGTSNSHYPSLSADGRYVSFYSDSASLVAGDTNAAADIFVRDLQQGITRQISIAADGAQANASSSTSVLSADGRFVVFGSSASNLVPGSGASHIYVVGGVSVAPVLKQFAADGGSAVVGVTFAYPGSSWIATSNDPWVTVTGQSGPSGSGNVSYSVAPNSSGIARTGTLTVAAQTVTIHQDASIAPTASDDTLTTAEDTQTSGTLNATDPNSDPLTFSIVTNGTLGVATIINPSTGAFTYTPAANVYGSDAFTFKANDGTTDSNVATVSITVSPVNDAPVASNGTLTTSQGTAASGTLAAADVDSLALGFALVSNGAKGTVIITNATTGAFTYTPTAGASGADSFSFSATDGTLNSNTATIVVTIVPSALTVTVVSPNGGEKLFANVPTTIHWTATGAISFDVALSRNGGVTYVAIAGCTGVSGSATSCAWTPTGPATTTALVRVTARSGTTTAVDASNAVFSIATASPSITVTSPNTAVAWAIGSARVITWNHNLGANSFVRIELTRNGGASWEIVAPSFQNSTATSGTLSWMVSGPTTSNAVVRISWTDGATSDIGNSSFSIAAPVIAVTTPDTNVSWKTGSIKSIRWTHNLGTAERVRIELSRDGGASWVSLASALENSSATSGTFDWAVTGPATAAARIRVSWTRNGAVQDMSGVNFRIQ